MKTVLAKKSLKAAVKILYMPKNKVRQALIIFKQEHLKNKNVAKVKSALSCKQQRN